MVSSMPITPLHLGPGFLVKAVAGGRLSFTVFALSQVFMDVEVIARLVLGADRLRGFSNTVLGATVVLLPAVLVGRPLCQSFIDWFTRNSSASLGSFVNPEERISWRAAWWGGVLGVYTHWFLDAMMHADAQALWPFIDNNPLINWLSIGQVNLLSLLLIIVGSIALGIASVYYGRRT